MGAVQSNAVAVGTVKEELQGWHHIRLTDEDAESNEGLQGWLVASHGCHRCRAGQDEGHIVGHNSEATHGSSAMGSQKHTSGYHCRACSMAGWKTSSKYGSMAAMLCSSRGVAATEGSADISEGKASSVPEHPQ